MARATLVLDASVGVKWFSSTGEDNLVQALDIRQSLDLAQRVYNRAIPNREETNGN